MAFVVQVLPLIGLVALVIAALLLLQWRVGRGVSSRRPREDPELQHHQHSARSHLGGSGW